MLKSTKNRRLLSLVMALVVIGSVLCGAVVPGLASNGANSASGPGTTNLAAQTTPVSSVTVSDDYVTLTVKQTEGNLLSVSGALKDKSADIYGGKYNIYAGDYVFTVWLNANGEISDQLLSIDYSYCSSVNNVLEISVGYSLKVNGKYELKTTPSKSFGVITYLPDLGLIGAPAGTTYTSTDTTVKTLADKYVPADIVKNADESFILMYNGGNILMRKTANGLSQAEKDAKKRFEELYASLADKLYDRVTETVEITPDELKTLSDAYNALPDTVKALASIKEKHDNIVLSEFVVLNMEIIVKPKDEVTKADEESIDEAIDDYGKLSSSDKSLMIDEYNDLIAKKKQIAISEITELGSGGGEDVEDAIDEYIGKINAPEVDTPEEIAALVEEFKNKFVDIARDEALAALDTKYNEIISSSDYAGFEDSSKTDLLNAYEAAKNAINTATSSETVKSALASGVLSLDRKEAKAKILAFLDDTDSAAVLAIADSAYNAIDAENDPTRIDAIVEKAILDIIKQRAKDEVGKYADGLNFPTGHESLVDGVLDDAGSLIDATTNADEVDLAVEKSKALLDLTKAYLEQLETIDPADPSAQNKQNVLSSAYEKATEKVKAAENSNNVANALNEGLAAINGAISNAHRLQFYEAHKEILEKTDITKDDLNAINAALDDMKNNYTPTEQATLDDYRDNLLGKKKTAITDAINGNKTGSDFDAVIDAYVNEINGLDVLGDTAADNAVNTRLDEIYADVLYTVEVNLKRQALREELTNKVRELKNSGKYNFTQQGELGSELEAILVDLDALSLTVSDADAVLNTFRTGAVAKIMAVEISYIANGELKADGVNADKDYGDGHNTLINGLWATVKNENGMPGASALTVEQIILKPLTVKAHKVVTGTFDEGKAYDAVNKKKALLTVDIEIKADGNVFASENNGTYTVRLLLPENLREATGLQLISYDANGDVLIYDTRKEGNFLVFDTNVLTEFTVIGDQTINLMWLAFVLGGIFSLEIISTAIVAVRRKKAGKEDNSDENGGGEKMYSFALPILAVVFTPAGIIPALIVLGALSVVGGGVLAYQIKKSVSKPKAEEAEETEEVSEETAEEISENTVTEITTENVEAVSEEAPEEIAEENEEVAEEETEEVEEPVEEEAAEEVVEEEAAKEEPEVQPVVVAADESEEEQEEENVEEAEEPTEDVVETVVEETEEVDETDESSDRSKKILILPVVGGDADEEEDETPEENDESDDEEIMVALPDDAEGDDEEDKKVFSGIFGDRIYVTYDYSFESKLVQSTEEVQRRYYELSELLLSYKIKKRRSWKKERYFLKGKNYVHMIFRGKTLCLCMAIAPESLEGTKYSFENVGGVKKYESVPVMVRVRSGRGCKYAAELIKMMFDEAGIPQKYQPEDKFELLPYEDKQQLIDRGAIKMLMTDGSGEVVNADFEAMKSGKFNLMNEGMPIMKRVSAEDVAAIPDEAATPFVETELESDDEITYGRRKGIVNIDTISAAFSDGDVVTINALKAKHLVPKNIHFVKVLARGILDKNLTVKAHDFSMDAVKMIVIAGGNVVKLKSKRI